MISTIRIDLLDVFGAEYISQHVRQEWAREQKSEAWKLYVAETLRCISESTAKFAGGPYMTAKWDYIIHPKPTETRTPEQVVDHVLKRLASL